MRNCDFDFKSNISVKNCWWCAWTVYKVVYNTLQLTYTTLSLIFSTSRLRILFFLRFCCRKTLNFEKLVNFWKLHAVFKRNRTHACCTRPNGLCNLVSLWKFTRADFSQIALERPDYLYKLLQKIVLTNFILYEWSACALN